MGYAAVILSTAMLQFHKILNNPGISQNDRKINRLFCHIECLDLECLHSRSDFAIENTGLRGSMCMSMVGIIGPTNS